MRLRFLISRYSSAGRNLFAQASKPKIKLQQQYRSFQQTTRRYENFGSFDLTKKALSSLEARPHIVALIGATTFLSLTVVERVPGTGRWRINFMPDRLVQQIHERMAAPLLKDFRERTLPETASEVKLAQSILNRLTPNIGVSHKRSLEIWVEDNPRPQAHAILDTIIISTGLIRLADSEDSLASIIGHEIAHIITCHSREKLNLALMFSPLFFLLGLPLVYYHGNGDYIRCLYNVIIGLPTSRRREHEADYLGMMIMARSCYDPRKVMQIKERLAEVEEAEEQQQSLHPDPWFTSTHPLGPERIRKAKEWLPEALAQSKASGCCQTIAWRKQLKS